MRAAAVAYLIALGWYLRWSGLDADIARVIKDGWDLTVAHTTTVVTRQRDELDRQLAEEVVREVNGWGPRMKQEATP